MLGFNMAEKEEKTELHVKPEVQTPSLHRASALPEERFVLKTYKRGKLFFKLGMFMVMTMPPSIFYYKKHQKDLYARGIIKDMQRINEKGKSIHDIPRYGTDVSFGKRL